MTKTPDKAAQASRKNEAPAGKPASAAEASASGSGKSVNAERSEDRAVGSMPHTAQSSPEALESGEGQERELEAPVNYDPETQTNPKPEDIGAVGKLDR